MTTVIEGVDWRLVGYAGDDGDLVDVPVGVAASVRFEGDQVSGSGGCNRFAGDWSGDQEALAIGPLAGTMMACEDPAGAVESAVLRRLGEVTRALAEGERLELLAADARVLLRYEASAISLSGTAWVATGVNNGRGGVVSLLEDTTITASFGADGHVTGSGGCNRYGGTWFVDGDAMTIGPLATTRRMCPGPDGVMDQEGAFLAAMARVATWRIDGERLELRDGDGALQASFAAA